MPPILIDRRTAALLLIAALVPRRASAQSPLQLSSSLSAGATDNARAAPRGSALVVPDGFGIVDLAGRLTFGGPRAAHILSYRFGATFYADTPDSNARSHQADWRARFGLTPTVELVSHAAVAHSRLSSVDPLTPTTAPRVAAPGGPVSYLTATAGQEVTARPGARHRLLGGLEVTYLRPLAPPEPLPDPLITDLRLVGARQAALTTLSLESVLSYTHRSAVRGADGQQATPRERTAGAELLARWQRQLAPAWSASIAAGLQGLRQIGAGALVLGPAWSATLDFRREGGAAGLAVDHRPEPNVYFGEAVVADRAALRAFLPLDRAEQLSLGVLASAEHARMVTGGRRLATAYDLVTAGASIGWRFRRWPLGLRLEYDLFDQRGRALEGREIPGLFRQVAMLSASGLFPSVGDRAR
jgi:hypothetical protein